MTSISWDTVGNRIFQTGIDRGVLYLPDGSGVPWNGLTAVEEEADVTTNSYYMDGRKFLESQTRGDFSAKLKAFTYPEEFEYLIGDVSFSPGMHIHDQRSFPFGLSYRSRIGNDLEGVEFGYKIHLLYNIFATPDAVSYESLGDQTLPIEFSWTLTSTPVLVSEHRASAHVSIDSTRTEISIFNQIENILYGFGGDPPGMPTIDELIALGTE